VKICSIIILTPFSRFNSTLAEARRKNLEGVYDPYTNLMHYPKSTQPTHVRWEQVELNSPDADLSYTAKIENTKAATNGDIHMVNGTELALEEDSLQEKSKDTIFTPVAPIYSRNYAIVDTEFEAPKSSTFGIPGKDKEDYEYDVGPKGLTDVTDDVLAELPPECMEAFLIARAQEQQWKDKWGGEATHGKRGALRRQL
jgi:chromatin structure-remodeling complex protein RSC7